MCVIGNSKTQLMRLLMATFLMVPLLSGAAAEPTDSSSAGESAVADKAAADKAAADKVAAEEQRKRDLLNSHFSAGLFANINVGPKRRVQSARLVGATGQQVVRIEEESKAQIGFLLEAHSFIFGVDSSSTARGWASGPFVGVITSGSEGLSDLVNFSLRV